MRVLLISEAEKRAAHKVALYAALPEHHYRPGPGATAPGEIAGHCLRLGLMGDFRCVFSYTASDGGLYRHLSISVPTRGKIPHPAFAMEIAKLFGFKGSVADGTWHAHVNKEDNCIILAQRI
jgi:hypothetical protein